MTTDFGQEFDQIWSPSSQYEHLNAFASNLLLQCRLVKRPDEQNVKLEEVIERSTQFPVPFPINTCRIISQPLDRHDIIKQQVLSAYPLIHERVAWLYIKFLEHKTQYGNRLEKELYSNLSLTDFVHRLLTKRAVSFWGKNDNFLLLNGATGQSGFLDIGTDKQNHPHTLENCLSYDEIKLSAFLSVSSHSDFINDGNRTNSGVVEKDLTKIERSGVIIGLIGARLTRRNLMEYQDIIISKQQNTLANGYYPSCTESQEKVNYRALWNAFYEKSSILYEHVRRNGKRFGDSKNADDIFDHLLMKKRYQISIDTFLLESQARTEAAGKRGYLHVVGIGLGVWRTSRQQEEIFLRTFAERLKVLLPLKNIAFIHFSWFIMQRCGDIFNGNLIEHADHLDKGIRILVSRRNPADKLKGPDMENILPIISYAWDGNALPGNEFWMGKLRSTGDPAAACSTLITELHNPHINTDMVSGQNLHIASSDFGIKHISEYAELKCKKMKL